MRIKVKRFDKKLPLPKYEKQAAGFDLTCRKGMTLKPRETKVMPLNIAMQIPDGYFVLIAPRSSTFSRLGLEVPNSVGVIDPFFRGNDNEINILFRNVTEKPVKIRKGDRLVQGILIKYEKVEFAEADKLPKSRRGAWKERRRRK